MDIIGVFGQTGWYYNDNVARATSRQDRRLEYTL